MFGLERGSLGTWPALINNFISATCGDLISSTSSISHVGSAALITQVKLLNI